MALVLNLFFWGFFFYFMITADGRKPKSAWPGLLVYAVVVVVIWNAVP